MSWLTLHISSPLHSKSDHQESQELLGNCHCTCCTCTTHVSVDHEASAHPPPAHTTCSHPFQEAQPMLKASHQHYSPHSMLTCSTQSNCHQPTNICPCIQPAPTSPMPCTQHSIVTATQPCLALQPPSPYIRNQQLSHQCHVPSHKVSTTCCYLLSKSFSTHHGSPLPWPQGIMWSKVPPHAAPHHCSSI